MAVVRQKWSRVGSVSNIMKLSPKRARLIAEYFHSQPVQEVCLFGSYARGEANRKSDIDLFVRVDFGTLRQINVAVCRKELSALLGVHVDLYEHHKLPKYVRRSVLAERSVIYKRSAEVKGIYQTSMHEKNSLPSELDSLK